jgi:methylase of polypeptide subunit release factors
MVATLKAVPERSILVQPATRALIWAAHESHPVSKSGRAVRSLFERLPSKTSLFFRLAFQEAERLDDDETLEIAKQLKQPLEDALGGCLTDSRTPSEIKRRGAVFTPAWLARRVAQRASKTWALLNPNGALPRSIGDLSCGTGALLAAIDSNFAGNAKVIGIDRDPVAVHYATLLKASRNLHWQLFNCDSLASGKIQTQLFEQAEEAEPLQFDLLLGNPPYIRASNLDRQYADFIRQQFTSADGNFDLSVAFLENAIERLNEGGIFTYILTSKFSQSSYGERICRKLATEVQILNVEHYSDQQLFDGYTTYILILTASKRPPAKKFSLTSYATSVSNPTNEVTVAVEKLKSFPWEFASPGAGQVLSLLQKKEHPLLTDVFSGIFQGVRTGANDIFVIDAKREVSLERDFLVPFVSGREIKPFQIDRAAQKLIFPYETNEFGDVSLIDPIQLQKRAPLIWRHLCDHQSALAERSHDEGAGWFAFSRSQNLLGHKRRKILVKEMMPRAEFAADLRGDVAFGAGYALDGNHMSSEELMLMAGLLNTPTMEFALRHAGTQLHSGWFRLLKHHLKKVRVPRLEGSARGAALKLSTELHNARRALSSKDLLVALDDIVARAFGLSEENRIQIADDLAESHAKLRREEPLKKKIGTTPESINTNKTNDENSLLDPYEPVKLSRFDVLHRDRSDLHHAVTFKENKSQPVHRWYPYTQGFSTNLVKHLLDEFGCTSADLVLDPFGGCGTTAVTCQAKGIPSISLDVSPLSTWIGSVKAQNYDVDILETQISAIDLSLDPQRLLQVFTPPVLFSDYFRQAFSQRILCQVFEILRRITQSDVAETTKKFMRLALLSELENLSNIRKHGSHYRFLNKHSSVGLQKLNIPTISESADVGVLLNQKLHSMIADLKSVPINPIPPRSIFLTGDARCLDDIQDESISHVITSPPYLNRNNYIAQQKAELLLGDFISTADEYRLLVRSTFRSHVESQLDTEPRSSLPEVNLLIEKMIQTPGNNPKIPHMICGYFSDLTQTMRAISKKLRPGGRAAFVIGNTRWGGVVIPIDHLLLLIGEAIGLIPDRLWVTRMKGNSPQQMRRFGRIPVRESIALFRKPFS